MSREEQTRRRCSRLGLAVLAVGAALIIVGGTNSLVFGAGRVTGGNVWAAGVIYVFGGVGFRPETWERIGLPFLPQRTPMTGILPTVFATASLWVGTIRPVLF